MTRTQAAELGERIVAVEKDVKHLGDDLKAMAQAAKESAAQAREDRKMLHAKLDAVIDELRRDRKDAEQRDAATNGRISTYENQFKGGWKILALLHALLLPVAGSVGAAVMYWFKSGGPPPPLR